MDRESSLSESNISTLSLGYTKSRYGIIQIGTISIEAPNRNSQLYIYIKSLSSGYQSQLIIKISIQDLYIRNIRYNIYLFVIILWKLVCLKKKSKTPSLLSPCIYIYIYYTRINYNLKYYINGTHAFFDSIDSHS